MSKCVPGGIDESWLAERFIRRGMSLKAIAREAGCSDVTVAAAVRHFGLTHRNNRPAPDPVLIAQAVRLYQDEGLDVRAVANETGLARDRVAALLQDAGVRLRGRGARPEQWLNPEELAGRYLAGASLRELAIQTQADDGAVRSALIAAGVVIRPRGAASRWREVLSQAFLQEEFGRRGRLPADIAAEVGCATSTVRAALRKYGFTRQTR